MRYESGSLSLLSKLRLLVLSLSSVQVSFLTILKVSQYDFPVQVQYDHLSCIYNLLPPLLQRDIQ